MSNKTLTRSALRRLKRPFKPIVRRSRTEADVFRSRRGGADVAIFHEFHAPPYGGGNQFLLALLDEFERRNLDLELNRVSAGTPVCLFNSFNFDFARLRRFAGRGGR